MIGGEIRLIIIFKLVKLVKTCQNLALRAPRGATSVPRVAAGTQWPTIVFPLPRGALAVLHVAFVVPGVVLWVARSEWLAPLVVPCAVFVVRAWRS